MLKYILLVVLFLGATTLIFLSPWVFREEVNDSILPWTTLMLAFVAVFTVFITTDLNKRQAATQKEHDFKQRNLAIIED